MTAGSSDVAGGRADSSAAPRPLRSGSRCRRCSTRRFAAGVTLFIALAAAALSYDHALIVARLVHTERWLAFVVPLLPDGMIVLCSAALYDGALDNVRPFWAMAGLGLGIGVTVLLNVAAGWQYGAGARWLNALPPVALVISIEVLIGIFRRGRDHVCAVVTLTAEQGPLPPVHDALAALADSYSQVELANAISVSRAHLQRHWPRAEQSAAALLNGNGSGPHE
jgi:hypothetical protein